jgi:hypothetical protein
MSDLTEFVYKVEDKFYFDSENYSENGTPLTLKYEDGDMIKWIWENKKMMGTIRQQGYDLGLFYIENVRQLQ